MSPIIVLLFAAFVAYVFSQFGGRLTARNSLAWWAVFAFLLFGVIWPEGLTPVAQVLGIQLVSNMVLGAISLFLVFQTVQESAFATSHARKLRDVVCNTAAARYLERAGFDTTPATPSEGSKNVLVIVPCYNEEKSLPVVLGRLKSLRSAKYNFHICVVNDGSVDQSERILRAELPRGHTSHLVNVGVSGALLTGFRVLTGAGFDYAVQCDADGQHPIDQIPELVAQAEQGGLDLLIGSRFSQAGSASAGWTPKLVDESTTITRRIGSLLVIMMLAIFSRGRKITDPTSGFRVYSRKACQYLSRFMPDEYPEPEAIAILAVAGARIGEVPVKMAARQAGVSSLSGLKGLQFMLKVTTALFGLRLRTLTRRMAPTVEW